MPDAVTTQILHDGPRLAIVKLTNLSDGSGEAAVTKVDISTLSGAPDEVRLEEVEYHTSGMGVVLLWDADTDVPIVSIGADGNGCLKPDVPIRNNAGAGKTGDIKLTTTGATLNDAYTLILRLSKRKVGL